MILINEDIDAFKDERTTWRSMHSSPGCSSCAVPLRSQYSCHWSDCLSLNSSGGGAYAALQQDPIGQVALLVHVPPPSESHQQHRHGRTPTDGTHAH
ncbi:hypothetical protein R3I93_000880 [Phoxinus phoxinus]|uniref:Uncharacterized protein n=1 Tax=Phoxinus phoxinus TaxID=58324 RepID=A0AAN9DM72_9TELE